jgi:hypothetical protein
VVAQQLRGNNWAGVHIENLRGLFDEYANDWNPSMWNQDLEYMVNSFFDAKNASKRKFWHTTTVSDSKGSLCSKEKRKK